MKRQKCGERPIFNISAGWTFQFFNNFLCQSERFKIIYIEFNFMKFISKFERSWVWI